ncbi:MAG: hypothetical protein WDN67_01840 [Candidatus Moraniibacteriota bacterium]
MNTDTEYLSLWEASKLSPYSQEYLGLLARKKMLKAVKINKRWFTTRDWLAEYVEEKNPGTSLLEEASRAPQASDRPRERSLLSPALIVIASLLVLIFIGYLRLSHQIAHLEAESDSLQESMQQENGLANPEMFQMFQKQDLAF